MKSACRSRVVSRTVSTAAVLASLCISLAGYGQSAGPGSSPRAVRQYRVANWTVEGPEQGPSDAPARDIQLSVTFQHQSGASRYVVPGFWDGDGRGGVRGCVFKIRFCPTETGDWKVTRVTSNVNGFGDELLGSTVRCLPSDHPGFWIADGRWYRRSDGTHPFIVGNTHYSFLARRNDRGPIQSTAVQDVRQNAYYYKKLRFSLFGDRYPDPELKPFLDDAGDPTDDGRYAFRPNPRWFHERVDPVIQAGFERDLICDLILCGPDTPQSRSTLQGDPTAWLRYVAARYGSFPNVWYCLCNEWDIKQPRYTSQQIVDAGEYLRQTLPYDSPISVHGDQDDWKVDLNGDWNDHTIIQKKLKEIAAAVDVTTRNADLGGGKPIVNDENAYEGDGDGFTELDVLRGCLGTVIGGGYPTTGQKHGKKLGQYFWGDFDAGLHTASDHLNWLRNYFDTSVDFWRLKPIAVRQSPFASAADARVLGEDGREYVVSFAGGGDPVRIELPAGRWTIRSIDLARPTTRTLESDASGHRVLEPPSSGAWFLHCRRNEPKFLHQTDVSIANGRWLINGHLTQPGSAAEGLLMNVRMVNSTFEDLRRPDFDADANTERFVAQTADYRRHGVRAFTLCLQGGMPGYEGAENSAFRDDGSLNPDYLKRVARVIEVCDRLSMAVILGCYYQRQDQILRDEHAVRTGVQNVASWIHQRGYKNVVLEIANEYRHPGYDHQLLRSHEGEVELIRLAKETNPRLLVSTSGLGNGELDPRVAAVSDLLLIHFNGVPVPQIPTKIQALKRYGKPIVCNEDDKRGADAAQAARLSVENGASWGFMHSDINQYFPLEFHGGQDDPIVYDAIDGLTTPSSPLPDAIP